MQYCTAAYTSLSLHAPRHHWRAASRTLLSTYAISPCSGQKLPVCRVRCRDGEPSSYAARNKTLEDHRSCYKVESLVRIKVFAVTVGETLITKVLPMRPIPLQSCLESSSSACKNLHPLPLLYIFYHFPSSHLSSKDKNVVWKPIALGC